MDPQSFLLGLGAGLASVFGLLWTGWSIRGLIADQREAALDAELEARAEALSEALAQGESGRDAAVGMLAAWRRTAEARGAPASRRGVRMLLGAPDAGAEPPPAGGEAEGQDDRDLEA